MMSEHNEWIKDKLSRSPEQVYKDEILTESYTDTIECLAAERDTLKERVAEYGKCKMDHTSIR
jgi:phage host-nuclease inhibitor protein Gam